MLKSYWGMRTCFDQCQRRPCNNCLDIYHDYLVNSSFRRTNYSEKRDLMQKKFQSFNQSKASLTRMPFMTYFFLAVNIIVYVVTLWRFGTTENTFALLLMGAKYSPLIIAEQEWWRLLTAAFLHIGVQHLLMNGITLYFLGQELETIMGHWRFTFVYLSAAIGGNIFSFAMSPSVSAGASTAIFGMFASIIVLSKMYPRSHILKQRASTYTILIVLNVVSGLMSSGIDNWGHFGGAIYGAIATLIIGLAVKNDTSKKERLFALVIGVILTVLLIMYGIYQYS